MKNSVRVAGAVALGLLVACGPHVPPQTMFARFSSYVDPAYRGTTRPVPRAVLVAAPKMSIKSRRAVETAMAGALRVCGIEPVLGMDVFPPTRGVPNETEVADELRARGLDYALVFEPTEESVQTRTGTHNVPVTTTDWFFVGGRWREVEVRTTVPQQYNVRLPERNYVAELMTPAATKAWRAEGAARSTSFQNSFTDLAATAATAVVEQMQRDGIVPPPPPPPRRARDHDGDDQPPAAPAAAVATTVPLSPLPGPLTRSAYLLAKAGAPLWRNCRKSCARSSGRSSGRKWPAPSKTVSWARSAAAVRRPCSSAKKGSRVPQPTSQRARMRGSCNSMGL